MLEDALRTEHFMVSLAEELNLLLLVRLTVGYLRAAVSLLRALSRRGLLHRQGCQYCIVNRQIVDEAVVGNLIEWALD